MRSIVPATTAMSLSLSKPRWAAGGKTGLERVRDEVEQRLAVADDAEFELVGPGAGQRLERVDQHVAAAPGLEGDPGVSLISLRIGRAAGRPIVFSRSPSTSAPTPPLINRMLFMFALPAAAMVVQSARSFQRRACASSAP